MTPGGSVSNASPGETMPRLDLKREWESGANATGETWHDWGELPGPETPWVRSDPEGWGGWGE